ncbi:MAG: hypothetical protein ACKPE1_15035 [Dolichospermum sp.]
MRYILSPLSKSGEGVGGGVTLYLITSVSAVNPQIGIEKDIIFHSYLL